MEKLLHVRLTKWYSTSWTLAVSGVEVPFDTLVAKHMATLGNDDILLPLVAHIAVKQLAHGIVFFL